MIENILCKGLKYVLAIKNIKNGSAVAIILYEFYQLLMDLYRLGRFQLTENVLSKISFMPLFCLTLEASKSAISLFL